MPCVAGVDGCRAGWISVCLDADGGPPVARIAASIAAVFDAPEAPAVVGVDMPIGLPERIAGSGRAAEQAVRGLLGPRRSSVFAIPSRAAVEAVTPQPVGLAALMEGHRRASAVALATSDPPRGVSFQAFNLFPRIRELDAALRESPARLHRAREVHPEVAFWAMNGERPLRFAKKAKGRPDPRGLAERRALLLSHGLPEALVAGPAPRGAGEDDLLDACAVAIAARMIAQGRGRPHPPDHGHDRFGLPIAIWSWGPPEDLPA
jgi:predicted RNase H-like nuclease